MGMDGEIDYRSYTRQQLEDALARIDRTHYPRNYQNLVDELERRRTAEQGAAAAAATQAAAAGVVRYRPEFKATPEEYFRIWIVNLALTIATLGIYSAWAKVRKLRYFYSSTLLAGSAFGYHADPIKILRGRVIAAALAAAYFAATRTSPRATIAMLAVIAVATPWLVVKSRIFTMRVTSWRGLRFDFAADYAGAYRTLLGWLLLGVVSLGVLMPRLIRERYRFIVTRSRYGATPFDCNPGIGQFYRTAFGAIGLALVLFIVLAVVMMIVTAVGKAHLVPPTPLKYLTIAAMVAWYVIVLAVMQGYIHARNLNEVFAHTSLGPHRLTSRLSATELIFIYLRNIFFIVFTLGLYTPWAQIRLTRYRLEALELEAHGSLDEFVAAATAAVPAAAGEEISSFLDVDFGF
ncbi:MAG: YjgN family protein [Steroidobacteraceae bacterium]